MYHMDLQDASAAGNGGQGLDEQLVLGPGMCAGGRVALESRQVNGNWRGRLGRVKWPGNPSERWASRSVQSTYVCAPRCLCVVHTCVCVRLGACV